ncbi:MAG: cadmium-translocating P-type ATPase [Deltaproteobacteria bacterium]|nr:cadmium-translocating P-type ATPase [Deltaproteobacteria bacterium]
MDCADCAATLAKTLEKLAGVRASSINFATSRLKIEYTPRRFEIERLERELKKAGYRLAEAGATERLDLVVEEMDCADESTIIEKQLKRLPGINELQFNLVARELRVSYDPERLKPEQIIEAVDATGMQARLKGGHRPAESTWMRHRHLILTTVSGVFILAALGFSLAGYPHTITDSLYILAILTGGYFIARKGLLALRTFSLDMNFLMTVAVIGAAAIEQWLEGATVMFLFSVANILQNYTMNRARNAIRSLMELSPNMVVVKRNGKEEDVPVQDVGIGEKILVRPGEKIGLDGRVVAGSSSVNQAPITGESLPVAKTVGDSVFAGTINQNGSLEVEVTHGYQDTTLSRIIHMVEEAQSQKAPSQSFVEKFARYYTPAVIGVAVLIAALPPLVLGLSFTVWFYRSLVLLVIACPCALVISTPVSIVSGLTAAARVGILIKGGICLEETGHLKVFVFDKTGTLTRGKPAVTDIIPLNEYSADEVLRLAAAIECYSEHHLASAIVEEAERKGLQYPRPEDFQAIPGKGAQANIEGHLFYIGNHRLLEEQKKCDAEIDNILSALQEQRKTAVILANQERALGIVAIADEVRQESRMALQQLKADGIEKIVMLTGDNRGTAAAIARSLPIDDYRAELMPEDKAAVVKELMHEWGKVAMVGDGVNDAPALAVASVGIAMGTIGTDTALETADIALMTDDLSRLPLVRRLSRKTLRTIKQNIAFSLLTKAVFIALAIPGFATLWMAVGADMGASLLVILNGLRILQGVELQQTG